MSTYGEPGPVASRPEAPRHFLRSRRPHDLLNWVRARHIISRLNPDIPHCQNPADWLHAALAGKPYKKLFHMHGPFTPATMSWVQRLLANETRRIVDAEVCLSRGMWDMVLGLGWGDSNRTWAVYNAIDCAYCETLPSKERARQALGISQNCRLTAVVCRLVW